MQEDKFAQKQTRNSFDKRFNLHPNEALSFSHKINNHLRLFCDSFKERIQVELDYSKSLYKVSKRLQKYVNPEEPTPLSYLSSAFQVQHEQRARHALELAEYLHTQIEVPCQGLLVETQAMIKQFQKEFKRCYKDGQSVEDNYKKYLNKYVRAKQEWEEKLLTTITMNFLPGLSQKQLEKNRAKLEQQKHQIHNIENRYINNLEMFNNFATKYNEYIETPLNHLSSQCIKNLALQSDSLRKLIVSEVNMFKNIQYDLLNISRQMELLNPSHQLDHFAQQEASVFSSPIITIYQQGPVTQRTSEIDLKYPIRKSFFEETLLKIESGQLRWMLDNKHNSTLRYSLQQAWKKFDGQQSQDFMLDLEESILKNQVVTNIPFDGKKQHLSPDQVFQISFSIICNIGTFVRDVPLAEQKQKQAIKNLKKHVSCHHFYRFIACLTLQEFLLLKDNKIASSVERMRFLMVIRLLLQESFAAKDTFTLRFILALLFQNCDSDPLFSEPIISELDFWNENGVWESIFFQGTYEQISLLPSMVKSELKQIYLMRQKNVMFSALTEYCHFMVMMGCDLLQVKRISLRFCRAYNLYDEHQKDIFKLINQSYQQCLKKKQEIQAQKKEAVEDKEDKSQDNTQGSSSKSSVNTSET